MNKYARKSAKSFWINWNGYRWLVNANNKVKKEILWNNHLSVNISDSEHWVWLLTNPWTAPSCLSHPSPLFLSLSLSLFLSLSISLSLFLSHTLRIQNILYVLRFRTFFFLVGGGVSDLSYAGYWVAALACTCTEWWGEIGSLTPQDASELHAFSDLREQISLHQAVHALIHVCNLCMHRQSCLQLVEKKNIIKHVTKDMGSTLLIVSLAHILAFSYSLSLSLSLSLFHSVSFSLPLFFSHTNYILHWRTWKASMIPCVRLGTGRWPECGVFILFVQSCVAVNVLSPRMRLSCMLRSLGTAISWSLTERVKRQFCDLSF